jgi:hypothetical protein
VRKILREQAQARQQPHTALQSAPKRAPRAKKTDTHQLRIEALLDKYDDITAQRVFEIIVEDGYDGRLHGRSKTCCGHCGPKPKPKASLQTPDWGPGKMAESDWSPVHGQAAQTRRQLLKVAALWRTFWRIASASTTKPSRATACTS